MRSKQFLLAKIGLIWQLAQPVYAQPIVADQTLPHPSIVTLTGNTLIITGGTSAGPNLFHSFQTFSVPTNGVASFRGLAAPVTHIFSRVTGTDPSKIDGRIEVREADGSISSADLFLLNPNGIVFGPRASLNLGGSFLGITGDRIQFADNSQFSADPTQTTPLLTITTPIGIQFGQHPGLIQNQARDLQAAPGQTLALLGRDITFQSGIALAETGHIELGSVSPAAQLRLQPTTTGWGIQYDRTLPSGSIYLNDHSIVGGFDGSTITIRGRAIRVAGGSQIVAQTEQSSGLTPSAAVQLHATDSIVLTGQDSLIGTIAQDTADAIPLQITTAHLVVQAGAAIASETRGSGRGGDLQIRVRDLRMQSGARVGSATTDAGRGGNVSIRATHSIHLQDDPIAPPQGTEAIPDPTQIYAIATETARANTQAGRLTLTTDQLTVRDGAQVNASTFGAADAGQLTVRANTINLTGVRLETGGNPFFNRQGFTLGSGLFTQANRRPSDNTAGTGNGGNLRIDTQQLTIRNGAAVGANTYGFGNAGNIAIYAGDWVEINGVAARGDRQVPSGIYSTAGGIQRLSVTYPDARGRGGDVNINTPRLRVLNNAFVGVSSSSTDPRSSGAGQLSVDAALIQLNRGNLNAETESGRFATIDLHQVDLLTMDNDSTISTSAGLTTGRGTGGNIAIATHFLVASSRNNDITANAIEQNAGNVTIDASGILGIEPRTAPTSESDITATSQQQANGTILITTPTTDLTRSFVRLPTTLVDASQLIARRCTARIATNRFVVTGRGGLPPNPEQPLRHALTIAPDWIPLDATSQSSLESSAVFVRESDRTSSTVTGDKLPDEAIEANGWRVDLHGEVSLITQTSSSPLQFSTRSAETCQNP